jgi:dTDP-4-dehydrorhamnose 3,5-epimerase
VTSTEALFHYKCTDFYHPDAEGVIRWNDPTLGIDWPIDSPTLSERDQNAPLFEDLPSERFEFGASQSVVP